MRILGLFHRNRVAPVLFLLVALGFAAGCGENAPATPPGGVTADTQAKQDSESAARLKAYGKSGIAPGTKRAAESAPKQ